jgi:KipI family sensor histidine kinase inhibitor
VQLKFADLAGELRLALGAAPDEQAAIDRKKYEIDVRFGGKFGPDLDAVASQLNLTARSFVKAHNANPLRVLATGFAPGFVYCGMHADALILPRRQQVRAKVPAGTILFAAGQTAITATPIPTGWHVIGHTDFLNFDPKGDPPTTFRPGDEITFRDAGK